MAAGVHSAPVGHRVIKPKNDQSGTEIAGEAGQNYYLRAGGGKRGMFHGAHKNLVMVMKEQATYEIKQLKPLDPKDLTWPGTKPAQPKTADAKHEKSAAKRKAAPSLSAASWPPHSTRNER